MLDLSKYEYIAGVDEAGRGPLAGPVFAAAVILPKNFDNIFGINDSKKLSSKKRNGLFDIIIENSIDCAIAFENNQVIDEINILQASQNAMHKAIKSLKVNPNFLLIDGNYFNDIGIPYKTIIGGDAKQLSISAASILAKVKRDRWMVEVAHRKYPEYDFINNKGYGTKKHIQAIMKYGLTEIHRKSFTKKYQQNQLQIFD